MNINLHIENGQLVKYNPCLTTTGNMCCCEDISKSKLDSLGLGIVIYFRILKTIAGVFGFIIFINLPLLYIYSTNHEEFKSTDYKDFLFKTTLGNIGSCKISSIKIFL